MRQAHRFESERHDQVDDLLCETYCSSIRRWLFTTPVSMAAIMLVFAVADATLTGLVAVATLSYGAIVHLATLRLGRLQRGWWPIIAYSSYLATLGIWPAVAMPETLNGQIALLLVVAIALPMVGVALSANQWAAISSIIAGGAASLLGWISQPDAFDPYLPELALIISTVLSLSIVDEVSTQHRKLATSTVHVVRSKQIDPLTGLYRRSTFLDLIEDSLLDERNGTLYFIDINRFKVVNDTLGHQAGDQLLLMVAKRVSAALGDGDFAGRIGGDEIGIFMPGQTPDEVAATAMHLTRLFDDDFSLINHRVPVTASISAVSADETSSGAALMHQADIAMHAAKRDGRAMRIFDNQMRAELVRLEQTELDLRAALKNQEIGAHLQPIVDLTTGTVRSVEALGRWTRDGAAVAAADFFLSAKQSNLLPDITRAVAGDLIDFSDSITKLSDAPDRSDIPTLGINVEAGDLGDFLDWLDQQPVDPANWLVELTETQILNNYDEAVRDVRRAVAMGLGVVLDDFGTGYSSLYRILHLPLAGLKIDASFVAQVLHSPTARTIVSSTVHIADSCGLYVVAEGVETLGQAEALLELGVTMMQGYYFCRPVNPDLTLAVVADLKSDGPGPVTLRTTPHLHRNDHYLCQFGDLERLVTRAQDAELVEHRS